MRQASLPAEAAGYSCPPHPPLLHPHPALPLRPRAQGTRSPLEFLTPPSCEQCQFLSSQCTMPLELLTTWWGQKSGCWIDQSIARTRLAVLSSRGTPLSSLSLIHVSSSRHSKKSRYITLFLLSKKKSTNYRQPSWWYVIVEPVYGPMVSVMFLCNGSWRIFQFLTNQTYQPILDKSDTSSPIQSILLCCNLL